MKRVQFLLFPVLFLAMSSSCFAEEQQRLHILDEITPAWQRLDELTQSYLSDEQQKKVQQLAFAAAVSDICPGFEVDKEKFVDAFKEFNGEKQKSLPDAEQGQWRDKLLVAYGIATGLFSAEGMLVKEQFCSAAEELKKTSTDHYWQTAQ